MLTTNQREIVDILEFLSSSTASIYLIVQVLIHFPSQWIDSKKEKKKDKKDSIEKNKTDVRYSIAMGSDRREQTHREKKKTKKK